VTPASIADLLFDGPASGLWPLLAVPLISRFTCARIAGALESGRGSWRAAAAVAALPGLTMLVLIAAAMARSLAHMHPDDWAHALQHHFIWLAAPAIVLPALWKARRRGREVARLVSPARAPEARLARLAALTGVRCLQLPGATPECFVAGWRRPVVYVSAGALARLDDQELRAALAHEAAHIEGRDPALFQVLAFLGDLVWADGRAFAAFEAACERRADERALRSADRLTLAAALLAFLRSPARPVPGMASAAADGAWRIHALLGDGAAPPPPTSPRVRTGLAANAVLLAWPALHTGLATLFCGTA
jgi:Zn-dependent protease with chaperone function